MKLQALRLCNFQSFGTKSTELSLEDITFLIGPNGSGKTAVLQGLCRLFAYDPSLRRIRRSDFHTPHNDETSSEERELWIEADFTFPEAIMPFDNSTVAPHFNHMRLDDPQGVPRVRYRLEAKLDLDGDIDETLLYILDIDDSGNPLSTHVVPRSERNLIQVHYLPARRDPAEHITYGSNALLGRLLRSVNWDNERDKIKSLTDQISDNLAENASIKAISLCLDDIWKNLHKGDYFSTPQITFVTSEIEALLRHMSVSFTPGHTEALIDYSRLSDGQKSMLYLSLVLASQAIGRAVLSGEDESFAPEKLRPPIFTLIAIEEPENSLSPLYLGRIINTLNTLTSNGDAQSLIATHAPSMIRRVDPSRIRYLRLNENRQSTVSKIQLPEKEDEAHKFVREAVQAFPEIYFSRLVILGEGDSEEIVLPRIFQARGIPVDESAVTIAPLGGRHVNHFWRLLSGLNIPYLTLLDLDVGRFQGGWGRFKYVNDQLTKFQPSGRLPDEYTIPHWNCPDTDKKVRDFANYLNELEQLGVFFSEPMDLDFSMIKCYPEAYEIQEENVEQSTIQSVLGKKHHDPLQYNLDEQKLFAAYHQLFKLGSKPAAHINALANLSDDGLLDNLPGSLSRLSDAIIAKLQELPE